jgi:hypothetical protein
MTDDEILNIFAGMVGGQQGVWRMYRDEIVALYRLAANQQEEKADAK